MTGGFSQFARVLESLQPITARPVMPESGETYRNCTADEWDRLMAAKYEQNQLECAEYEQWKDSQND